MAIPPEHTTCPRCNGPMHVIGEETAERLDVIPAQYRVLVTRRPKYACRACANAVAPAPARERQIAGGLPTEAMVARLRKILLDSVKLAVDETPVLTQIAALNAIEKTIRGRNAEGRRAVRPQQSRPPVEALKSWLEAELARLRRVGDRQCNLRYGLKHLDGLVRFLDDGRIEIAQEAARAFR